MAPAMFSFGLSPKIEDSKSSSSVFVDVVCEVVDASSFSFETCKWLKWFPPVFCLP